MADQRNRDFPRNYSLNLDGTERIDWPDGGRVWSSVNIAHLRDAHFHAALARELGLG